MTIRSGALINPLGPIQPGSAPVGALPPGVLLNPIGPIIGAPSFGPPPIGPGPAQRIVPTNPLVPPGYQDDLAGRLADSAAFGDLGGLLLGADDTDIAQLLGNIYVAGGQQNPSVYWALQMSLAGRFGGAVPQIPDAQVAQSAQQTYQDYGAGLGDFVDAVAGTTQQFFSDQGVAEVTAYHGIDYPTPPADLKFDLSVQPASVAVSGITVYAQDPQMVLNGMQASEGALHSGATGATGAVHVIFGQVVPVDQVWSVSPDGVMQAFPTDPTAAYMGWTSKDIPPDGATVGDLLGGEIEAPEGFTLQAGEFVSGPVGGGGDEAPPEGPAAPPGEPTGPPAPPGDIYQQTWDFRDQLLQHVASAQEVLANYYAGAYDALSDELDSLAAKIAAAQENGEEVDPNWLAREGQLADTLQHIADQMDAFAQQAQQTVAQGIQDAAALGVSAGTAQLDALLPAQLAAAGVQQQWGTPSDQALENSVGAGQSPQSPLNMAFAAFGQAAIDMIKHGLFNGLATGQNPHTVASQLASDVQDLSLNRANTIARTEMLRSYRTANQMMYQENSDVVDGWIWVAALSTNTCAFCWAENGGYHSSDETLDSHAQCACVMVPMTGDWSSVLSDLEDIGLDESDLEEMGINFDDIIDTSADVPMGEDVFAEQPPEVQEEVLGPSKYALYQNGDLALSDLIGHEQDEQWGGVGYEKSLKDLGFTRDDVIRAQEELAAREAKGETPEEMVKQAAPEKPAVSPSTEALQALAKLDAMEAEAKAAAAHARAEAAKGQSILTRLKNFYDTIFQHRATDRAWHEELDAIDKRLFHARLKVQEGQYGKPLAELVAEADRRLFEQRYQAAKVARGGGPLMEEVRAIEQRQAEERLKHPPQSFAAKPQEVRPSAPTKTYELTPEDKAFAANLREQIGPEGVVDHQAAIEIGKQLQGRIGEQLSEIKSYVAETVSMRDRVPALTDADRAWVNGDKAAVDAHGGVKFTDVAATYQSEYRARVASYLAEVRGDAGGLGGEALKFDMSGEKADPYVRDQLTEATKLVPTDWIKASNDLGAITPERNRATNSTGHYVDDISGPGEIALSYNKQSDPLAVQTVALHELIHRAESAVPHLSRMEQNFYNERTAGESYQRLKNGIGLDTKVDQWLDEYLGAQPGVNLRPPYHDLQLGIESRTVAHYELLSNGADMAMGHAPAAVEFARDPEYEAFVLGSLAGVKARPVAEMPFAEKAPSPGEPGGGPAYKLPKQAPANPEPFHQLETPIKPTSEEQAQGMRVRSAKKAPEAPLTFEEAATPAPSLELAPQEELKNQAKTLLKLFDATNTKETIIESKQRIQQDIGERVAGDADWEKLKAKLKPPDGTDAGAMRVLTDGWGFGFGGKISTALRIASNAEFGLGDAHNLIAKGKYDAAMAEFGPFMPGLRKVVRAMYDATQDYFKANGITDVPVYRGASWQQLPEGLKIEDLDRKYSQVEMTLQPMSPFTVDPAMASTFSVAGVGSHTASAEHHLVIGARIPVEQIMSTAWTGFGSKAESEMIYLGGKAKMWGTAVEGVGKAVPTEQIRGLLAKEESPKFPRAYPEGTPKEVIKATKGAPGKPPLVKAGEVSVPKVVKEPVAKPPKPPTAAQLAKQAKAKALEQLAANTKVETDPTDPSGMITITKPNGDKITVRPDLAKGGYIVGHNYTMAGATHWLYDEGKTLVQVNKLLETYTGGLKKMISADMLPESPKISAATLKEQAKAGYLAQLHLHTEENGAVTAYVPGYGWQGPAGGHYVAIQADTAYGGYKITHTYTDGQPPKTYTHQSLKEINSSLTQAMAMHELPYATHGSLVTADMLPETTPPKPAAEVKAAKEAAAFHVESSDKATFTVPEGDWNGGSVYTIEPDMNLGGYKVTVQHPDGYSPALSEGMTAKQLNSYYKSQIGYKILPEGALEPGPPKTAAEKKAYTDQQHAAEIAAHHAQQVAQAQAALEAQYAVLPASKNALETKAASMIKMQTIDGVQAIIKKIGTGPGATFSVEITTAGHGVSALPQTYDSLAKVNKALKDAGITNKAVASSFNGAPSSTSSHGSQAAYIENPTVVDVGHYSVKYTAPGGFVPASFKIDIIGTSKGGVDIKFANDNYENLVGVPPEEAKARLTLMGVKDPSVLHFVDAAAHDAAHYEGPIPPEQQARIAQVEARRTELDEKYGEYAKAEATRLTKEIRNEYEKALGAAISAHLGGGAGTHLSVSSVVKMIKNAIASTPEAKRVIAQDLIARLREVTEWSLLHDKRLTRAGTIRLFHGSNGGQNENIEIWQQRLAEFDRRGTPFTTDYNTAKSFASLSTREHAELLISAQVPVEDVLTWYGIRGDTEFASEQEYTLGDGQVYDFMIINANDATLLYDAEPLPGEPPPEYNASENVPTAEGVA
jgi:Phage Mu protein F like protein